MIEESVAIERKEKKFAKFANAFRFLRQVNKSVSEDGQLLKEPEVKEEPPVPLKVRLQSLPRFVMDKSQNVYYYWIGLMALTVVYNCIILPMRASFIDFYQLAPSTWIIIDYVIDFLYLMDIFIGSRTGYLEQGLLVRDLEKLRMAYVKRKEFLLDMLTLLPTDLFYLTDYVTFTSAWIRFNRIAKIYRLFEYVDRTETRTVFPNLFRISTLTTYILILIHLNGCIYFAFSRYSGLGSNSFLYPPRDSDDVSDVQMNITQRWDNLFSKYVYSFYWSTLILTTIGETPRPVEDGEYIFLTIDFLAGVLIFATVVGNVGSMITNMNAAKTEFQSRMDNVKRYMEFRHVSQELEHRVIRWFDYLWSNKKSLEDDGVLGVLPEKLKAEIAIHVHLDTLKQVAIFKDCEPGLLVELVLKLKLQVFSPGDYICRKGDIGKEMYIVKRGKLEVVGMDGKTVFVTLGEGAVFGEISILNIPGNKNGNRRTANVRSIGYSDLFSLSKNDLWETLAEYPEAKAKLLKMGHELLRKDNLIDDELLEKERAEQETTSECLERIDKTVRVLHKRLTKILSESGSNQSKIKKRLIKIEQHLALREAMTKGIDDEDDDDSGSCSQDETS